MTLDWNFIATLAIVGFSCFFVLRGYHHRIPIWLSKNHFFQHMGKEIKVIKRELLLKPYPKNMTRTTNRRCDVFICHASEDKKTVVGKIINGLKAEKISYWYDNNEIGWGDSLVGEIHRGLQISQYVLIVVSIAFAMKNWPKHEFHTALNEEISSGKTKVLPLLVGTPQEIQTILDKFPEIRGKLYLEWDGDATKVASAIKKRLGNRVDP